MTYDFKFWQELGWGCLVALIIQVATVLVTLDPAVITDWRAWFIALAGASIRAIAGVVIASFTSPVRRTL